MSGLLFIGIKHFQPSDMRLEIVLFLGICFIY